MKRTTFIIALFATFLLPSMAFAAETKGILPTDPRTLTENFISSYGDAIQTSWTSKFKRTGKCKNAQLQFTSKRSFGPPEEESANTGFYFYSSDFLSILETEGMYSKKLEGKFSRFEFSYVYPGGKKGDERAAIQTRCLELGRAFKSPLQIYYGGEGLYPYKGPLVASIPFKEKK